MNVQGVVKYDYDNRLTKDEHQAIETPKTASKLTKDEH